MSFSSFSFLLLLVPLFPVYLMFPKRWKNVILLLASLGFYAWGEPRYMILLLVSIAATYLFGRLMQPQKHSGVRRFWLIFSLVFHLGLLIAFKYADFFFGALFTLPEIELPLGISFYTFHAISYLVDVYRQKTPPQRNIIHLALYIALFPKLTMGPIVSYHELEPQLKEHSVTPRQTADGCLFFAIGLAKKALLADTLGSMAAAIWATPDLLTWLSAWLGLIGYAMQLYFDFSGYSDMAVGLGLMLGFRLPENFRYPYLCTTISDFWRRWHITLGAWFKEYLYFPLGGSRAGTVNTIRNLLIVWLATGLWHGASLTYVVWGLYFGVLICLEKLFLPKTMGKSVKFCYRVLCIFLILMRWTVFRAPSLKTAGMYFSGLFSFAAADAPSRLFLHDNWGYLVAGLVGLTPIPARLAGCVASKLTPAVLDVVKCVLMLALLALSVFWLVNNTFQGFLYAQF